MVSCTAWIDAADCIVQWDGVTALHDASAKGHAECVLLLLDRGASVDVVNVSSWLAFRTHHVALLCARCIATA